MQHYDIFSQNDEFKLSNFGKFSNIITLASHQEGWHTLKKENSRSASGNCHQLQSLKELCNFVN